MKQLLSAGVLVLWSLVSGAQHTHTKFCNHTKMTERFRETHPELGPGIEHSTRYLEELIRQYEANRGGGELEVFIVPIVFHIIHDNGPENVSDEQVLNAINILNRDLRKQNNDTALVVDQFTSLIGDASIEFRLATRDPLGNCTTGINRVESELTYSGGDEVKELINWPRNMYLNVYVCAEASGAAGYAYLPGMADSWWGAQVDGIVLKHNYLGAIGTSSNTTSRTLTHEVGHYLNLLHTWGPTNDPGQAENCETDDLVEDTPNTIGFTSCNLAGNTCGGGVDNVQNYMEYSYCSRMFTIGQCARMRATLQSPVAERNELITPSNLLATGVVDPPLCLAKFSASVRTLCAGGSVQFTDASYHGVINWSWNFGDGTVVSGSDPMVHKNPAHTYDTPGVYTVSLTVSNGSESESSTQTGSVTVLSPAMEAGPVQEGFEASFPGSDWFIENEDASFTWEVTPSAFYSGTRSARLRNYSNEVLGNSDAFTSPTIDMSGMDSVYISYRWAYASRTVATNDRLRISVSGNCGDSWVLKRLRSGNSNLPTATAINSMFTPTSITQWNGETLGMADDTLMNDHFRVRFEFIGNGGNNIFLDDINIWGVTSTGVGMVEYTASYGLRIFPNPTTENAQVEWTQFEQRPLELELYNSLGQLCHRWAAPQLAAGTHRVDLPRQTTGLYHLVIRTGEQSLTRKIVFR
jgi:PKD repeat protein